MLIQCSAKKKHSDNFQRNAFQHHVYINCLSINLLKNVINVSTHRPLLAQIGAEISERLMGVHKAVTSVR